MDIEMPRATYSLVKQFVPEVSLKEVKNLINQVGLDECGTFERHGEKGVL